MEKSAYLYMPVIQECCACFSICSVGFVIWTITNSSWFIFHTDLIDADLKLLCRFKEAFLIFPERDTYFYFILFFLIPAGILTTWPDEGLYFESDEENLKFDSLINREPMEGSMVATCTLWALAWLCFELT